MSLLIVEVTANVALYTRLRYDVTKLANSKDNDVGGVVVLCNSSQASGTHAFGP